MGPLEPQGPQVSYRCRVQNGPRSVSVRVAPTILVRPSVRGASRWSARPSAALPLVRPVRPRRLSEASPSVRVRGFLELYAITFS